VADASGAERVYAPHELLAEPLSARVLVGGRVLLLTPQVLTLGDAFARLQVRLEVPPSEQVSIGSLCVVSGEWGGAQSAERADEPSRAQLQQARIVQAHAGQFSPRGESMRFGQVARNLRAVQRAKQFVRAHFDAQGFIEVTTPLRVAAPGTDVYIAPHATSQGWLITSPEFQMKRLLVGGVPSIYQFATCSRDEESGPWHQPEFTLLEWYRSFAEAARVMTDTEELVAGICDAVTGQHSVQRGALRIALRPPFERLSVRDAFAEFAGVSDAVQLALADEARYFEIMVSQVEPALARYPRPVFLTEYPASQAALARRCEHDPSVAQRFELYLGGVELCNGYGELTCPREQRARFEADQRQRNERGLPALPIDEQFLQALQEGMPPAAGNALGFERLLALVLAVPLADVVAFPR
jgi:elongation factor P--(R)-beta-lysine ligase